MTREQVELDGSVLVQAMTQDILMLAEAYERCQIDRAALVAAQELILERRRIILEEIAAANGE